MRSLIQILLRLWAKPLQEGIHSGKVAINVFCYICLRVGLYLMCRTEESSHWIKRHIKFHWANFPFRLHGCLLWSPSLQAWYRFLDWDSFQAMNGADFPSSWVRPQPGDVWIDCGAHVGRYAVQAARLVAPDGLVVAIEPHPENFRELVHNLASNQICNVLPIRAAVWSEAMDLRLSTIPEQSFSHKIGDNGSAAALLVRSVTLDGLVKGLNLPSVNWIKLDVEGAECEVLKGAEWVLDCFHPTLLIEVHDTWACLRSTLETLGYHIEESESLPTEPGKGWVLARPCEELEPNAHRV